jgi:hypothetical protein
MHGSGCESQSIQRPLKGQAAPFYGRFGADGGDAEQNITSVISPVSLIRCIINDVYVIKMFL